MSAHLSARSRLTLLYASLFTLGGAALVLITYLLVAHTLHATTSARIPPAVQRDIARCVEAVQAKGGGASGMQKCDAVYANGVQAGAAAQRTTTLGHLLTYSLLSLAGVILLAAVAGWIAAGRILRPVHRLTAAARAASEQDLSQRIALQGPRDELRELADTFDAMLERLDRAFTSQRQFIANASHELRTPLTVMRTAMDVVLARPDPTGQELMSMAAEVRQAVDHSERLIEVLLALARSDQARARSDPLDLAAVAEDALEGRATSGITTTSSLDEAPVTGDAVLLERLIANLLDNAERYNIAGGTITISTASCDGTSFLRVINTGTLVPADMVERLFLPFTRLDDRTRHDGSGLGLALVSSIATVHGGTVDATAPVSGGLDITVRLPRRGQALLSVARASVGGVDDDAVAVRLEAWTEADLSLLQQANTPEMTAHLGGPETQEKLLGRHRRYLRDRDPAAGLMFAVVLPDGQRAGIIGYWERTWRDEVVYETGWSVMPAFQGRGIATAAARAVADRARTHGRRRYLHAFPGADHPASNAICRKAGFTLLGETDFEYPPGTLMRCNDWRLEL